MAEEADPKASKVGKASLLAAGGTAGFFGGMLAHRAVTTSPLPIETFDWILKNGSAAFFLAGLFVVGAAYYQERRERTRDQTKHSAEIKGLMRGQQDMLVPLVRKLTRALAINSEVIRGHAISLSEAEELSDDTPDGTPHPPSSTGPEG